MTAAEPLTVYDVPKICPCGNEWEGKSFSPPDPEGRSTLGRCPECVAAWREALDRVLARRPAITAAPTADHSSPYPSKREGGR